MKLKLQKRLAGSVFGCSPKKVWLNPVYSDKIKEAITKADIRNLVIKGFVQQKRDAPQSRGRVRKRQMQRSKGRRKGFGNRKGTKKARNPKKETWMDKIRLQRKFLAMLKEKGYIDNKAHREVYLKAKGGFFRSRRHLKIYLDEHNLFLKK